MEYVKLYYKKLCKQAITPIRVTTYSARLDLTSAFDYNILPYKKVTIDTGIQFVVPLGYYGRIASRSGKTERHSLQVGAGVIDPDYTGTVKIIMFNFSSQVYRVKQGERIVQLILEKIAVLLLEEIEDVSSTADVTLTTRGNQGFGSTDSDRYVSQVEQGIKFNL